MKTIPLKEKKLELTNDGNLSLFFIGTGSSFTKRHSQTNLLIIKNKDHLLIDCGSKCPQTLYELGVSIAEIDNFLITHSHADHIGGLEEVSLINRYFTSKKPNMVINETYQHILWDMSLRGGCAYSEEKAGTVLDFSDFWNILRPRWLQNHPRETFETEIGSINLKIFRTKHFPDSSESWETSFWSCGVIIDNKIMFTGDTRFDADLIEPFDEIYRFETIFHDCQFFEGGVHASLEEINALPQSIKEKTFLIHYGDDWENHEKKVSDYGFAGLGQQHIYYIYE